MNRAWRWKRTGDYPLWLGFPPLHPYPLSYPLQCLLSLEFWNFPSYNLTFIEGKPRNRQLPSPVLGEFGGNAEEESGRVLWIFHFSPVKYLKKSVGQWSPVLSTCQCQVTPIRFLLFFAANKSCQNVASWNNLWLSLGSVCWLVSLGWLFFEVFYVVAVWEGRGWSYLKAQLGWMSSMASSFVCGALMLFLVALGQSSHETAQSQRDGRIDPIFKEECRACPKREETGRDYGDMLPQSARGHIFPVLR